MPLTPLQRRVVEVVSSTPGSGDFVLAGGAALAVLGIGDRTTKDLDWFAQQPQTVDHFAPTLLRACTQAGLRVQRLRAEPGFHRFQISDAQDTTIVDLAWDARLRPPSPSVCGPVLHRDELAADKMLALFGRAAPRDFVDVYRLRAFYSRDQLCALAAEKDHGFNGPIFGQMLGKLHSYERIEFPLDDAAFTDMREGFEGWQQELALETPRASLQRDPPSLDPPELELD